jgi:hypothetical protein
LDEASLFDAFDNLKSVPKLQDLQTAVPLANKQSVIEELPVKVVFAYRGVELETLKGAIDKYKKERNIKAKNLPNLIVVNKKYHLSKVSPDGCQEAGKPFQEWGTMQTRANTPYIGGISLMHMLTQIQKYANVGSSLFSIMTIITFK